MRKAARRDANESALVKLFEQHGCAVAKLSQKDVPDLLIGWGNNLALCEVKVPKRGKLKPGQVQFRQRFPMTQVVRTEREALGVIAKLKEQ